MNFITASSLRKKLSESLDAVIASRNPLLVSRRGKVVAGLVDIDLLEDLLDLSDKEFVKSIKEAREQVEKGDTFTHEEVFGEI